MLYNEEELHCTVHEEFMKQVTILTTHIVWLRRVGSWGIGVLLILGIAMGGSMFNMTYQIAEVHAEGTATKEALIRHLDNRQIHYSGVHSNAISK